MEVINLGVPFFTNCYIEENLDECFIVDPGSNFKAINEKINKPVKFILLTHGHSDHIDAIGNFKCPIYIHESDYEMLFNVELSLYSNWGQKPSFNPNELNIIKVKDNDLIPFGKENIKVISTPGHTKGSVCYLYKDKLYSGDTLFKESMGRTDFPSGSEQQMKKSLVDLIDSIPDNVRVYPGHGEKTTIKEERINNQYYIYFKKSLKK